MSGQTRILAFAEGVSTGAPSQVGVSAVNASSFVDDAAYVTDKGAPAANADLYYATGVHAFRGYRNSAWRSFVDNSSTETLSNKTFDTVTNITNTTDSSSKDTGCLVLEGGLGVEKSVYIGLNLVIGGDLTVNGTTTTINTATLDVEDANITVNKGGTQSTANTNVSGFKVEMSDATHAQIGYDSSLASKFKGGNVGSESELITATHTQTLSNKTIASGIATTLFRLNSGADLRYYDSTNTNFVGVKAPASVTTSYTLTLPSDTPTSNQYLKSSSAGIYNWEWPLMNRNVANFGAERDTSGWATYADAAGTSPVDGTGGSPASTFARNTTNRIEGDADFIWTKSAANRQGEGFSYDFGIKNGQRGRLIPIEFDYSTSANYVTSDMLVFVYDITNATLITPIFTSIAADSFGHFRSAFLTASNSTSYRLIFHTATTSALAYTVQVDNIYPDTLFNSAESVFFNANAATATITGTFSDISWTELSDTNNAFNGTTFTVPKSGLYYITAQVTVGATFALGNSCDISIMRNGVEILRGQNRPDGSVTTKTVTANQMFRLSKDDLIKVQVASNATSPTMNATATFHQFSITKVGY